MQLPAVRSIAWLGLGQRKIIRHIMAVAQYQVSGSLVPLETVPIVSKVLGEGNNFLIGDAKKKHTKTKMIVSYR